MKGTFAHLLACCLFAACAACAGSAQTQAPAASPVASPEPSPAAPPAAQSKSAYPGGSSNDATTPSAAGASMAPQTESLQPAPASAPPQAPAMTPADTSRDRAEASKANKGGAGDLARAEREIANGDCATACRALGSMERAVAFICMQSQGDDGGANRCADARTRLIASRRRVRSSCGSCAGGPSVDPDAPVPSTR